MKKNVAYRTIATAMTHVALRDFGRSAVIGRARIEVPDRRGGIDSYVDIAIQHIKKGK